MQVDRKKLIMEIFMQFREMRNHMVHSKKTFLKMPLFPAQAQIIEMINKEPGIKQSQISQRLNITPSAVTQSIIALEKLGLLTRTPNEEDRREFNLLLTNKSKQDIKEFMQDNQEHFLKLFECLSDEEIIQLKNIHQKIITNLKDKKV